MSLTPYYERDGIVIYCKDCLEVMPQLAADSFDLIFVDWPYYKVKGESWDRQWGDKEKFLEWIGQTLEQARRLLRANGSFYGCASPQMSWAVEGGIRKYFNVLNRITWHKDAGWHKKTKKEELRQFLSPYESIIFAEHYGAEGYAKGEAGYGAKCDELRGFVFEPLRAYLDGERRRAGIDFEQVRQIVGCRPGSGLPSHWFTKSQWALPTEENYLKLQAAFNANCNGSGPQYLRREYEDLRREYEDLRREYEDLRREYEDLRRPFNSSQDTPHTDLWDFKPVSDYPGKHPTQKPLAMLEHIVSISSRTGARVLDFTMGSGTTLVAAQNEGRQAVGIDTNEDYCRMAINRLRQRSFFSLPQMNGNGRKAEQLEIEL